MLIEWQDVIYEYDERNIDVRTACAIKEHTGCGMLSWIKGIDDGDPLCLQGLLYAMKVQNGERPNFRQLDDLPVFEFFGVVIDAMRVRLHEIAAEAVRAGSKLDPTVTADASS